MRLRDVESALLKRGCKILSDKGPHTKWVCPCGAHTAPVPRHSIVSPGSSSECQQAHGVPAGRVVAVSVYQVTARRWVHGWELHIHDDAGEEIGVTQSRSLAGAKRMVCDYLALDLDGEPEYYDVTITPELDGNLATEAEAARRAV